MPNFLVELTDGRKFQVEADTPPTEADLQQYMGQSEAPKEEPMIDISDTLKAAGQAIGGITTTAPHAFRQLYSGLENPWQRSEGYKESQAGLDKYQQELEAANQAAVKSGDISTSSRGMRQAGQSLGFSAGAMGASLAGGSTAGMAGRYIGGLAGPEGAIAGEAGGRVIGALGASYGAAYRMAGAQFLDDASKEIDAKFMEKLGRLPNKQEQDEAYAELKPLAEAFGHAEAGPEAIGNLAMAKAGKFILGLGIKNIKGLAAGALAKVGAGAGGLATELGGETVTQVEQNRIEQQKNALLSGQKPLEQGARTLGEYQTALGEVAPATLATMGLIGSVPTAYKAGELAIKAYKQPANAAAAELLHAASVSSDDTELTNKATEEQIQASVDATVVGLGEQDAEDAAAFSENLRRTQEEGEAADIQAAQMRAQEEAAQAQAAADRQAQFEGLSQNEPAITTPVGGAIPAVGQEEATAIQPEQQLPDGLGVSEAPQLAANEPPSPEGVARNAEVIRQAAARLAGTEKGPDLGFAHPEATTEDQEISDWDKANRHYQGSEWFEGGRANVEVNKALDRAALVGGSDLATHGMAKESTLTGAMKSLLGLLNNNINKNRGGGRLYTAPLAVESGSAAQHAGTTSGGTSYRDGPFILVQSAEASKRGAGIQDMADVHAILVNDANKGQFEAIKKQILAVRPDMIVELMSSADKVAAKLTTQVSPATTGQPMPGGSAIERDATRLSRGKPRESIAFKKPVITPLGEVVGYSWSSQLVEDVDKAGEPILRRVSNWEEAANNAETGRDIVHRFLIRKPDGSASEVSLESTFGKMTAADKQTIKSVISAAKRLPFMRAELAELQDLQKRSDEDYQRTQKLVPDPAKFELREPDVEWRKKTGDKVAYLDGVFLEYVRGSDLNTKGELPSKAKFIYDNAWKWQGAQRKVEITPAQSDRLKSITRSVKKAEELLKKENVEVAKVTADEQPSSLAETGPPVSDMKTTSVTTDQPAPISYEPTNTKRGRQGSVDVGIPSGSAETVSPSGSTIERPSLGVTGKQILGAWRSIQGVQVAPGETVVGRDVNGGGTYAFINDRLVKLRRNDRGFETTYTEATDGDWQDVSDALDRGALQVEVRKITGLGGYQKADAGKTVRVLHQATGRPLQEFLDTPEGSAYEVRMQKAIADRGPKQSPQTTTVAAPTEGAVVDVTPVKAVESNAGKIDNSKVHPSLISADGTRKQLYHGKAGEFADSELKINPNNMTTLSGIGPAWFTTNKAQAHRFSVPKGNIMEPDMIALKKPLVIEGDEDSISRGKTLRGLLDFDRSNQIKNKSRYEWTEKEQQEWNEFYPRMKAFLDSEGVTKFKNGDSLAKFDRIEKMGASPNHIPITEEFRRRLDAAYKDLNHPDADPLNKVQRLEKEARVTLRATGNPRADKMPPGEAIRLALQIEGYDGIVLLNTMADTAKDEVGEGYQPSDWVIPFTPEQVVSKAPQAKETAPEKPSPVEKTEQSFQQETEAPSGKVEAGNAALDDIISQLPQVAQAKYTPEVREKAAKFFESGNQSDLKGLTVLQRTNVNEARYRADKEAADAQKAADKLYEKRLREEEKENARLEKERAKQAEETVKRSGAYDSIVGTPTGVEMNAVSEADGQEALAAVHNSGDVPGVLNAFVGTSSQFLANPENETNFPDLWKILSAGRVDEGNFAYGRAFVFTDGIGVNASDRRNAAILGITPAVAAVRRVLIHEGLVHRGIYGLPANLQMQILQWMRQNASPQELDSLAIDYPQYADWATNPQQMLGLCEEFLAKKIEKITKFPKDGPLARLFDILKDIWRWMTGETGEPTIQNLRDVVKLLKAGVVAADARLVNGGKVYIASNQYAFKTNGNRTTVSLNGQKIQGPTSSNLSGFPDAKNAANEEEAYFSSRESNDQRVASETLGKPVDATRRIERVTIPNALKGAGLGKALILAHLQQFPNTTFYNSQASPELTRAFQALARDGYISLNGEMAIGRQSLANHTITLTEKGKSTSPNSLLKKGGLKMSQLRAQGFVTPEMDAEYMAAVKSGDVAKQQAMVDDAINENLPRDYYHGGVAGGKGHVVQFVFGRPDESYWGGATTDRQLWRTKKTRQLTDEMIQFGAEYFGLSEEAAQDLMNPSNIIETAGAWDDPQFVSDFWQRFENDLVKNGDAFEVGNGAIAFPESGSIERISDPITYKDGKPVPLSQRFNPASNDIRESRVSKEAKSSLPSSNEYIKNTSIEGVAGTEPLGQYRRYANDYLNWRAKGTGLFNLVPALYVGDSGGRMEAASYPLQTRIGQDNRITIDIGNPISANFTGDEATAKKRIADAVDEEIIHAADLLALKAKWESEGSSGKLGDFVLSQTQKTTDDILQSYADMSSSDKAAMDAAIEASFSMYFGQSMGVKLPEFIAALRNNGRSDIEMSMLAELTRQVIQLRQTGGITETGWRSIAKPLIEWMQKMVDALRVGAQKIRDGQFGKILQSRVSDAEDQLRMLMSPNEIKASRISGNRPAFANPINAELARAAERMRAMGEKQVPQEAATSLDDVKRIVNASLSRAEVETLLKELNTDEVKDVVRSIGYPTTGTKADNIKRILSFVGSRADAIAIRGENPTIRNSPTIVRTPEQQAAFDEERRLENERARELDISIPKKKPTYDQEEWNRNMAAIMAPSSVPPAQIRSEIRAAYDRAIQGSGSVQAHIQQVFDEAKRAVPTLTERQFGEQLQALYEDGSAFLVPADRSDAMLAAGEKWGVYDASGMPASYVGVMPSEVKASRVSGETEAQHRKLVQEKKVNGPQVNYGGRPIQDENGNILEPTYQTEEGYENHLSIATKIVSDLINELPSPTDLPNELNSDEYLKGIGAERNIDLQQTLFFEGERVLRQMATEAKDPEESHALTRAAKDAGIYARQLRSGAGRALGRVGWQYKDARYAGQILVDGLEQAKATEQAEAVAGKFTEDVDEQVSSINTDANQEANTAMEGDLEETLENAQFEEGKKSLSEKARSLLAKIHAWIADLGAVRAALATKRGNIKASNAAERQSKYAKMTIEQLEAEESNLSKKVEAALEDLADELFNTSAKKKTGKKLTKKGAKKTAEKLARPSKKEKLLKGGKMTELQRILDKTREGWTWAQIFTLPEAGQVRRRADMLAKVQANEAFADLTEEEKAQLVDLLDQAWYDRKAAYFGRLLQRMGAKLPFASNKSVSLAVIQSIDKLLKHFNDGTFDKDAFREVLAEKFGIKPLDQENLAKAKKLAQEMQSPDISSPQWVRKADELTRLVSSGQKLSLARVLSDWWITAVLSGPRTLFAIATAFTNGLGRIIADGGTRLVMTGDIKSVASALKRYFEIWPTAFKEMGHYIVTGDKSILENSKEQLSKYMAEGLEGSNPITTSYQLLHWDKDKRPDAAAWERTQGKIMRAMGRFMTVIERVLGGLDHFNAATTKYGYLPLAIAQNQQIYKDARLPTEAEMGLFRNQAKAELFDGREPQTLAEKTVLDSWTRQISDKHYKEFQDVIDGANYAAQLAAMTTNPEGFAGGAYRLVLGAASKGRNAADKLAREAELLKQNPNANRYDIWLATTSAAAAQLAAYSAQNLLGVRFIRFVSNKFNDALTYIPIAGYLLRAGEKTNRTKTKTAIIHSNQAIGMFLGMVGWAAVKAIADEPDDEKRGWSIDGPWQNLSPEQKSQLMSSGRKANSITIGGHVLSYQGWPISAILSAIGTLTDMVKYQRDKWDEKDYGDRFFAATYVAATSVADTAALSQLSEILGKSVNSSDPIETGVKRFSKYGSNFAGGFVPRLFKDMDSWFSEGINKYDGVYENFAKEIPWFRRNVGAPRLDIFGEQVKVSRAPWSREFPRQPTDPAYALLGKLNQRDLWLAPSDPSLRTVGMGNRRRHLNPDEQNRYMQEVSKGYKDLVMRYGQKLLTMPGDRASDFLAKKAKEVRDSAEKKSIRRLATS